MINKELIDFISKRLDVARRDLIEKDIILTKILFHLSQNKDFSQNYVFKGGTCLIRCYLGYFRFSEDLDFTYLNQKEFVALSKKKIREVMSEKINKLGKLIEDIAKKLNLDFKIDKEDKKYLQFGGSNAFVTFKIWYYSKELGEETFVKIQVNHIEKLNYPIKKLTAGFILPKNLEKDFSFIASEDADILLKPVKIKVYDIREILLEKVRAILTRKGIKERDFLDVYMIENNKKLDIRDFKEQIIGKTKAMLRFEKYRNNLSKRLENKIDIKIGEEEKLLLIPISEKDLEKFLERFNILLQEIIKELSKEKK